MTKNTQVHLRPSIRFHYLLDRQRKGSRQRESMRRPPEPAIHPVAVTSMFLKVLFSLPNGKRKVVFSRGSTLEVVFEKLRFLMTFLRRLAFRRRPNCKGKFSFSNEDGCVWTATKTHATVVSKGCIMSILSNKTCLLYLKNFIKTSYYTNLHLIKTTTKVVSYW